MIDRAWFDKFWPAHVQFNTGDSVRYRKKGKDWREGHIALVWAGIEPVVDIEGGPSLFPTLGDEIEPAPIGEREAGK